ncbi:hypothetical protein CCR83_02450 [Rhodobacter veldkampii DSM 11550]|uniref:Heme NO-binding protein n=1 Tax=Phaeovulum veldkampii DSM 11550 TaxID=1185920 RepID=A0A2T4JME4_9RHOB|nr:heme NO-binding domain-containing protein [Phaeovulum veldkampii]MBK5945337.1 hypothetical protein [Phaeovulum veldkampii DSM 11550]PTE19081.1 heme NO-binding protein [Phaeovulum veldkampii DSM 11550]TDQ61365.1 heme-NO-binding protein [Phaeovulum veldkampii DSM 11550]
MHGLVNRSIQCFLGDTYGADLWAAVAAKAGAPVEGFEAMLRYDDALTCDLIQAATLRLGKPRAALLEDLGAYLVTREPLRRLMRFGGVDYTEFLLSLEDLQGRGLMALPDLDLPELGLESGAAGRFTLTVTAAQPGWGAVFAGMLRAMADDYGALALIEHVAPPVDHETTGAGQTGPGQPAPVRLGPQAAAQEWVTVELLEARFASGRRFDLAAMTTGA